MKLIQNCGNMNVITPKYKKTKKKNKKKIHGLNQKNHGLNQKKNMV